MESTRPIRALVRGLDALCMLNARGGATVAEVVGEIRLPRTTVYRVLETLCEAGFVHRDEHDDRYRVTSFVRGLADGLDDEALIAAVARPHLAECRRELAHPVGLATPSGPRMCVREPLPEGAAGATPRAFAVRREPLLASASGIVYLAYCPRPLRKRLIEAAVRAARRERREAPDTAEMDRLAEAARAAGHALMPAPAVAAQFALAVPVILDGRAIAALSLRFNSTTLPVQAAADRFLAKLRTCAVRIREDFQMTRVEARRWETPEAAP